MECWERASELFKSSILYGMFDHINSMAGNSVIEFLAKYYCSCYGGDFMFKKCPKLFECNAVHSIAYLIVTYGFKFTEATDPENEENDGSTYTVPPVTTDLEKYVKRDMVGRVTREYDWPPKPSDVCRSCDDDVLNQWKGIIQESARKCKNAHSPLFMPGGSFYPDCDFNTCCGADHGKTQRPWS